MLYKILLANASTCDRRRSGLLLVAAVLGLTMFCKPELNAATPTTLGYLQQTNLKIPVSPAALHLTNCTGMTCLYGPFNLPGYGNTVWVSFSSTSGQIPALGWQQEKGAEFQSTSNSLYNWGADTEIFSLYNDSSSGSFEKYTITFYFKGAIAPNPADLFLVVAGLASGTTAKLSPETGMNAGEYRFPAADLSCNPALPNPSLPTCPKGTAPTVPAAVFNGWTFSSDYDYIFPGSDPRNTGWDLYQPNSPNLRVLSLEVNQQPGDGLGFTLGYRICTALEGNSLDSRTNYRHLYDINTTTGAATNPRQIGLNWTLAFSPISPGGTLYALVQDLGTPRGNALFAVSPLYGWPTMQIPTQPLNTLSGGDVAADPTTGILYGIDGAGHLFSIGSFGIVTQIGTVGGTYYNGYQKISAMAFDNSGNLFLVDTGGYLLLEVPAPVNNSAVAHAIGKPLSAHRENGFAALAINPWTGIAYYAEDGELYTLNLATGSLTLIGPVTGAEDNGYLASLTFIELPLSGTGVCPSAAIPIL